MKKLLALALALVGLAVFSDFSAAQEERRPFSPTPVPPPCPPPFQQLTQPPIQVSTTNLIQSDFAPAQLNAPRAGLNDPGKNKHFLGSFQWKSSERCCQVTWGRLTVQMKSNSAGTNPPTSPDAGNDGFNVMASAVSVYGQAVYPSSPFPSGTPATINWILNPAALTKINNGGGLSFDVQDDTMVTSATLELRGCCLTIK
jgi:hypothetical protein